MPCFKSERSLPLTRCRREKRDEMGSKWVPVHPRPIRYHGLFGEKLVRQHLMFDERWSPESLASQFVGLNDLLSRHGIYKRLDSVATRARLVEESARLKSECKNGRAKLKKVSMGANTKGIRNILVKHRDMQRLYQRMPIHQVVDNINQRTFVMRKERDRLEYRLGQLKKSYRNQLMHRGMLENRIKYQNEYALEEETRSTVLMKKIENCDVRSKAIKAINTAYAKMIQVLRYDAMFYEPILRSLADDMDDQTNFIKHILFLGTPAIAKFNELNNEFRQLEEKARRHQIAKQQMQDSFEVRKSTHKSVLRTTRIPAPDPNRYVRETRSMVLIKNVSKVIEVVIKDLKFNTLCSQVGEIYPRVKGEVKRNQDAEISAEFKGLYRYSLEKKMKIASSTETILANNLGYEEIARLKNIEDLKAALAEESKFEQKTMEYIKQRADAFITLRWSLWNLIGVLYNVGYNPKTFRVNYPNSYLELPLLKFELFEMYSAAPEVLETDITKLLDTLKKKVLLLTRAYESQKRSEKRNTLECKEAYHSDFVASIQQQFYESDGSKQGDFADELFAQKAISGVPSRRQIKLRSAKDVEQAIRLLNA